MSRPKKEDAENNSDLYIAELTKREYFAGLAIQGLLSANAMYKGRTDDRESLCKDAIATADELLKQLES